MFRAIMLTAFIAGLVVAAFGANNGSLDISIYGLILSQVSMFVIAMEIFGDIRKVDESIDWLARKIRR